MSVSESFCKHKESKLLELGPLLLDEKNINDYYKFFLVETAIKNIGSHKARNPSLISDKIFELTNINITPEECGKILKKNRSLWSPGYKYSFSAAIIVSILLIINTTSVEGKLLALATIPLFMNFFHEFLIYLKLHFFNPKKLCPPAMQLQQGYLPTVVVVIASRNEPFHVAKMTFDSAAELEYPKDKLEIIVVDNSDLTDPNYEPWKTYVETFGGKNSDSGTNIKFIHRDGTYGFKPKNLDIALEHTTSKYILYLDVDSTLPKDCLIRAVPLFSFDKKLAFLQLQTSPTNFRGKSLLALAQSLRNYFLRLSTVYFSHASHCLFFGHNAIWRTDVVREIGGSLEFYNGDVLVTEDLSMSLRSSFLGYYGSGVWVDSGEWVPHSLRETEAMWLRWTVGTYQVIAKHFISTKNTKALTAYELIGWVNHFFVLLNFGLMPIYVILALTFNSSILMTLVLVSYLPELMQSYSGVSRFSLGKMSPLEKLWRVYYSTFILGTFINWVRCLGLFRYLFNIKQGWRPTGKAPDVAASFGSVIKSKRGFIGFALGCVLLSGYSLYFVNNNFFMLLMIFACGLYGINSILAVLLFGKSGMHESVEESVKTGGINHVNNFYL